MLLPRMQYSINVMMAAGRAMRMLARNLSFIRHPWVRVAMMVVSEMKLRLSPKKLPPTTAAVSSGRERPSRCAMPAAIGVRAAIVPQLVPMLMLTMQDAMKSPARISLSGSMSKLRLTTLSMHPMRLAVIEKAPASMKISSMSRMSLSFRVVLLCGILCAKIQINCRMGL